MGLKKLVSYEVARYLNKFHSGESLPHSMLYITGSKELYSIYNCPAGEDWNPAPEQAHVREWLRQRYDIHIRIIYEAYNYHLKVVHYKNHHHFLELNYSFKKHEDALNKGLIESLELINRHNISRAESEAILTNNILN